MYCPPAGPAACNELPTRARENAIFKFCAHAHSSTQPAAAVVELCFGSVEVMKTLIVLQSAP